MPRPTARHPALHAELLAAEVERELRSPNVEEGRAHIGISPCGGAGPPRSSHLRGDGHQNFGLKQPSAALLAVVAIIVLHRRRRACSCGVHIPP